ncbi:MAG: hypothetical protein V7638_4845 [Acidobacteriota bacterium]|jgi:hypothetical protein
MSKFFLFILCVGLLMLACGAPTNRNAQAPSTASTGEKIGIAECDDFIAAYETCVNSKVPESARPNVASSVANWRTAWKKMADDPQMRPSLAAHCKTQREQTMAAMKAYNCSW